MHAPLLGHADLYGAQNAICVDDRCVFRRRHYTATQIDINVPENRSQFAALKVWAFHPAFQRAHESKIPEHHLGTSITQVAELPGMTRACSSRSRASHRIEHIK